jgi:8-oxo-dGTP pyrophosphatase MutT (NUDIX family)
MTHRHHPRLVGARTIGAGDWLRIEQIEYVDHRGLARTWETVARQRAAGAVFMITMLHPSERYVLVRQYRPPVDGHVLEFPAGLVDPGEDPAETAVRELAEETGYTGTVAWLGPASLSSPGMSRETVTLAFMDVDESRPENQCPIQQCEDGEDIAVILRALTEIPALLRACRAEGVELDSRLVAFFLGLGLRW